MATKSILLKVTPEVHAAILEAAGRHQRSMQNVLVALIERWLEAGGPDPLVFDLGQPASAPSGTVDEEARRAIKGLADLVVELHDVRDVRFPSGDLAGPGWAERVIGGVHADLERRGVLRDIPVAPLQAGPAPTRSGVSSSFRKRQAPSVFKRVTPPDDATDQQREENGQGPEPNALV